MKTGCYRAISPNHGARQGQSQEHNMRLQHARNSGPLAATIAVLSTAILLTASNHASAQPYYYEPAPDYYHNDTAAGTFMGGAFGAVTGAIVGGKKNRGEGALIGAGVGAVTGNLLGRSKDRTDEQRAAYGAASVNQWNQQAAAQAVTNYDLQEMTRAGVSEDVIISTMRSRGARLDLSPNSLIALKQSGVSDRVVLAAQGMSPSSSPIVAPAPVVTQVVRPTRVIVAPAPWPCYDPYHYRHYHGHHHSHGHVHFGF
jgi:hypothetical protein